MPVETRTTRSEIAGQHREFIEVFSQTARCAVSTDGVARRPALSKRIDTDAVRIEVCERGAADTPRRARDV
jgi:hypothetical protein